MLEEALSSNQQATSTRNGSDPLAWAVEMEYEAFQTSKMANLYKATVLKKISEINKASKDGELYSNLVARVNGTTKVKTEPIVTTDDEYFQASKVNTFKPKRVGIGIRKTPAVFQSASEILAAKEETDVNPVKEESSPNWKGDCICDPEPVGIDNVLENKVTVTKEVSKNVGVPKKKGQHSTSDPIVSLGVSPTKKGKPTKKQQLLAETARKESQNIAKFFSISKEESKSAVCKFDLTEEQNSNLSELPQFPSQKVCKEKAGLKETEIVPKEEVGGTFQIEDDKSEKTADLTLGSHNSRAKSSYLGSIHEKSSCAKPLIEEEMANSYENRSGKRPGSTEDLESPAEKRLRMITTPSILLQSEGKAGGPVKKKVTFDPNLAQVDKEGTTKTIQPPTKALSLKETADIVVKYLTPFYKDGRFASKDLFKGFARHISHLLAADKNPLRRMVKEEAQRLIKLFFKNRSKCENEDDWQDLLSLET
ncbi:ATP-dependent DNA helicase Q5-like [Sceloporus undulatus]|uniref:ATP-dependent DNA helicase Q5-like n=1 Tax=Sceloporus undulatus TaxID=8520 RepID=UPI001C4D747F|nr:ATP-dependent DNA helicase Q5-like [Sceloporus undulatus]